MRVSEQSGLVATVRTVGWGFGVGLVVAARPEVVGRVGRGILGLAVEVRFWL